MKIDNLELSYLLNSEINSIEKLIDDCNCTMNYIQNISIPLNGDPDGTNENKIFQETQRCENLKTIHNLFIQLKDLNNKIIKINSILNRYNCVLDNNCSIIKDIKNIIND